MKKKMNIGKIMAYFSTFFLAAISYTLYLDSYSNLENNILDYKKIIFILDWVGVFIVIFSIISWYLITREVFSPYNIFMIFFFLFNYGQCIMWAFNIHLDLEIGKTPIYYGHWIPTDMDIIKTQIFTCVAMLFFHAGAIFCYKPKKIGKIKFNNYKDNLDLVYNSIFYVGVILGIIAFPSSIYRAFKFFIVSSQYGYKALYYSDYASQGGITMIIEMFFFPALICLLIGSKYKKNTTYIVYFIFGIYSVLNLLCGDRGSWIYKLLILLWLNNNYNMKLKLKNFIFFLIIGYFGLHILAIIVEFRNIGISEIQLSTIIDSFTKKSSPITDTIFEMGGAMSVITMLLRVGNEIWSYSNSYLTAILGVISTRLVPIFGLDFVLIDNWFSQDYLNISWGAGFSMLGEAFLTGGMYFAPIIMLVLGYFISTIIYVDKDIDPGQSPIRYFFVASSLHTWIGFSRGSSYLYLKTWFYGTIVVCILFFILKKVLILKNNRKYRIKSNSTFLIQKS